MKKDIHRGIYTRENKKGLAFEAYVSIKNSGKRSSKTFKAHVGTYPTLDEAIKARIQFINRLK